MRSMFPLKVSRNGRHLIDDQDHPFLYHADIAWRTAHRLSPDVDYIYPGKAASCQENEPEYKWVEQTKEANLKFSEVPGVDSARNYRRQWYVSGLSGRLQRQPADLPKEAEEALKFYATESNWVFNPYEQFEADSRRSKSN